jgi:hypothetical protein
MENCSPAVRWVFQSTISNQESTIDLTGQV